MPLLPPVSRYLSSSGVRIYRIACRVFPHLNARVFLLLGAGPPTLVDVGSGQCSSTADILAGIEDVRRRFGEPINVKDIRRIILTHGHLDHFGGLNDFVSLLGADVQIGVHPLDRGAIVMDGRWAEGVGDRLDGFLSKAGLEPHERRLLVEYYKNPGKADANGQYIPPSDGNGQAKLASIGRIANELVLADGQAADGLRFIHTPGHSPGHVCILIEDVLLCGDHILPRTLPQQWPECLEPGTGLRHYLSSLDKIESLPGVRLALGGHETSIPDVYKRIGEIRRSQNRRFQRVHDVVQNTRERLSLAEIGRRVYTQAEGFFSLLAITDVGARVEHLASRGELQIEDDGVVAWVCTGQSSITNVQ